MRWITRERPKIDRLACPWLIKRFIDPEADIIYVPLRDVIPRAKEFDAIPFDIPDVKFTHYQDKCTFDYFLEKYKLDDPALQIIALIVRGADTDAHHLSTQSSEALATFLPCFLFTVILAPSFKKIAGNKRVKAFVDGITAGVIGALVGSVIIIASSSIVDVYTALIALGTIFSASLY